MARLEAPCEWPHGYQGDDCAWLQGYVDGGGPDVYVAHLLRDVRPCEGNWRVAYENGYVSSFQFTPGTWSAAARATGFTDPLDPYDVGRNVAFLINELERTGISPGSTGGWPSCWWRGGIP